MLKPHCSINHYHRISPDHLDEYSYGVRDGIFNNNPPFVAPPIVQAAFEANILDYAAKRTAYEQGGAAQKGPYLNSRGTLMGNLDTFADYVDSLLGPLSVLDAEAMILLSGNVPTKTVASAGHAPGQPQTVTVKRGAAGELFVECEHIQGAAEYGCLLVESVELPATISINAGGQLIIAPIGGGGGPAPVPFPGGGAGVVIPSIHFDFNTQRKKKFQGLTRGTTYYAYMFAINAHGPGAMSVERHMMVAD